MHAYTTIALGWVSRRLTGALAGAMLCGASLACLSTGCMSARTAEDIDVTPEVIESAERFRREYVLAPGDEIEVLVRGNAEVSRQCMIRPDGYISLPLLNDVRASGLTVSDLGERLTDLFSARLKDPEVTVIALTVRQPMVYVLGDVGAPQPVPLRDARTVAQALAVSGGASRSAAVRHVAVIRLTEEGRLRAYTFPPEITGQPAAYMALNSVLLEPEDVIFVPESQRSQFVRSVNDYITTPLGGINQVLTPYFQFKLIELIDDD